MRLRRLRIQNYRSCYNTTVEFAEHVTLLVGENDAGKSNIVDALRASIPPVSGRVSKWFDADRDLSFGVPMGSTIQVQRVYTDLTESEDCFYAPVLVDSHRNLVHTSTYFTDPALHRRNRLINTVGDRMLPDVEPENRDRIAHVYLPPLRDAASALDSAGGNRLVEVFRILASAQEIAEFELQANETLRGLADHAASQRVVRGVQGHLTSVTRPVRHRVVDLKHRDQRIASLSRALRLHMAAEGFSPSDLMGSGLGYANLLFVATVVLELEKAKDSDLTILLVEEPEAHLHPQLQSVLLSYLEDQAEQSAARNEDANRPEGRIQIIATSHSPHLVSSLPTSQQVVVRSRQLEAVENHQVIVNEGPPGEPYAEDTEASANEVDPPVRSETVTIALAGISLSESERRKIDRYLDATRSAILFARQVVLVEGIAEALLLRTLAECVIFASNMDSLSDGNQALRQQFRAISVVPIGGVDFVPFLKLLLHDEWPLVDRLVVVTDGDGGDGDRRKRDICELFRAHVESGCLVVEVGSTTLEAELYSATGNEELLKEAFRTQHPRSLAKWNAINDDPEATPAERATKFSLALKEGRLDLGKGDFAHVMAELIRDRAPTEPFEVPGYLERAIRSSTLSTI